MKLMVSLTILLTMLSAFVGCSKASNGKTDVACPDSIVLFFIPYFSSNGYSTKELANIAQKSPITDTIWANHSDFVKLKALVNHKEYVKSRIIGVPELYIKCADKTIFLTQFTELAVDIDRKPIRTDTTIIPLINKMTHLYNYFSKEDLLSTRYFASNGIPKDYHYVYRKKGQEKTKNRRFKSKNPMKKGVKLLIVDCNQSTLYNKTLKAD